MNYTKRYVVYGTTRINYEPIDRTETLALCPVKFTGFISNSFETEQEAIETASSPIERELFDDNDKLLTKESC